MMSPDFENFWAEYTCVKRPRKLAAAGLAAATSGALFALPSGASAAVVYTNVNDTITWSNTAARASTQLHLALPAPGAQFEGYYIKTAGLLAPQVGSGKIGGVRASLGSFVTNGKASHGLKKFGKNSVITSKMSFHEVSNLAYGAPLNVLSGTKPLGDFGLNKTYYAGFKLNNGDLGFVKLEVANNGTNSPYPDEFTVVDYAINNSAGDPITIAQESVPEPTAERSMIPLMLLAGGYGSLKAWRKSRQAAA